MAKSLKGAHDIGMVVTAIVNRVAGKEVENAPSILYEECRSQAALIADVHSQQIKRPHQFRIYILGVALRRAGASIEFGNLIHTAPSSKTKGLSQWRLESPERYIARQKSGSRCPDPD